MLNVMKVLHVVAGIDKVSGGPSKMAVNLCQALNESGVESHIATTKDPLDRYSLIDYSKIADKVFFFERWKKDYLAFSIELSNWLEENVQNYQIVNIHSFFNYPSHMAAKIARKQNVPYVIRPAGTLTFWPEANFPFRKKLLLNCVEKNNVRSSSLFHATSEQEAEDLYKITHHGNIEVIPLGVKSSSGTEIPQRSDDEVLKLLFLGRLHPKKNIETLLQALKVVTESQTSVSLKVAGEPDPTMKAYANSLIHRTEELGLSKCVEFIGFVEGAEKQAAFKDAHAFVLPSYNENFGIAVAEALSYGLPAIISKQVALAPDVAASKSGVVTECSDVVSIASAIETLSADDALRSQMAQNALSLASKFSLSATVEALKKNYLQILNR